MEPIPTLPKRSWLERTSLGLAAALVAVSMLTLMGWWLRIDELLQPISAFGSLKINGALGFLALGLVLLALELGWRRWTPLACLPLVIGLVTLIEDLSGYDLSVDQLLAGDHLTTDTEHPGRIATMVAVCMVLGSLALL